MCEPACLIGLSLCCWNMWISQKGYFYCILCTQKNKIILKCAQQADERYYDGFHHYHLTHSYIHKQHSCNEAPDRKLLRLSNTGAHICIPLVATIRIPFVSMLKYSSKGIYIKLYKHSCSLVLFLMCLQQLLYLTGNLNIYSITLRNIVSGWLFKNCYGQSMYSCTEYKLWSFKQGQHCQIIWITFLILNVQIKSCIFQWQWRLQCGDLLKPSTSMAGIPFNVFSMFHVNVLSCGSTYNVFCRHLT